MNDKGMPVNDAARIPRTVAEEMAAGRRNTPDFAWPTVALQGAVLPAANLPLPGQNHHMMPGVPFYRYDRTFRDIRPLLEQNRARIEGFWPRTHKGSAPP